MSLYHNQLKYYWDLFSRLHDVSSSKVHGTVFKIVIMCKHQYWDEGHVTHTHTHTHTLTTIYTDSHTLTYTTNILASGQILITQSTSYCGFNIKIAFSKVISVCVCVCVIPWFRHRRSWIRCKDVNLEGRRWKMEEIVFWRRECWKWLQCSRGTVRVLNDKGERERARKF